MMSQQYLVSRFIRSYNNLQQRFQTDECVSKIENMYSQKYKVLRRIKDVCFVKGKSYREYPTRIDMSQDIYYKRLEVVEYGIQMTRLCIQYHPLISIKKERLESYLRRFLELRQSICYEYSQHINQVIKVKSE